MRAHALPNASALCGRTMTTYLLGFVTLLYAVAALDSLIRGNWGMALVLTGYTVANAGLLLLGERA